MVTTLRPLTTAELFDTTFSLYRRHFLLFVGLVAIPYLFLLPFQILNALMTQPFGGASVGVTLLLALAIVVVSLAVTAASQGATLVAVSEVYLDRPTSIAGALSRIRGEIVGLAALMIVIGMFTAIGLVLLIVPGILIALRFSLAVPVAVIEQETIRGAMSRSADLTEGHRWRILLIWVLFFLLTWVIAAVLGIPVGIATVMSAGVGGPGIVLPGWVLVMNVLSSFVASCLAGPFMTIAFAVLYYDIRVRKEAFDLKLLMDARDGGAAVTANTPRQG
jgi:hypothetical protein